MSSADADSLLVVSGPLRSTMSAIQSRSSSVNAVVPQRSLPPPPVGASRSKNAGAEPTTAVVAPTKIQQVLEARRRSIAKSNADASSSAAAPSGSEQQQKRGGADTSTDKQFEYL